MRHIVARLAAKRRDHLHTTETHTDMNIKIALAAILVLMLLVACGPAAPAGQNGGESDQTQIPAPTPTPANQDDGPSGPPPTPEPTPTPNPPPDVDPTETPEPTPTRPPGDPIPQPTAEPDRTEPTPAVGGTSTLRSWPAPPNGITGCYTLNSYSNTLLEFDYHAWCSDALLRDVSTNCAGVGDTAAELRCARHRLEDVQSYYLREMSTPCTAISDDSDRQQCLHTTAVTATEHLHATWAVWATIQNAVDSDAEVKATQARMADCVVKKGFARPGPGDSIAWQVNKPPQSIEKRGAEQSRAELEAIDQCAKDAGLYEAQETVWLSEIYRLQREDPERVHPLVENGLLTALEADGIAPFLAIPQ